jgi:hypothetical protein
MMFWGSDTGPLTGRSNLIELQRGLNLLSRGLSRIAILMPPDHVIAPGRRFKGRNSANGRCSGLAYESRYALLTLSALLVRNS